ncbi:AMMECR1 domain-containing protein [Cadophora sp. MPI-SDFR-AT-0126]|nr:AMMECR1 domain-containing protein [Leotiomycetes sp. MPI-SDFR-AT-0126]
MASVEHCLYCFGVLATTLEDKGADPISLERIQETWPSYPKGLEDDIRMASAELENDLEEPENDHQIRDELDGLEPAADKASSSRLRLPALQRLGRSSNSPASSSSTPSSASSTSLAPSTTATTPESFSQVGLKPHRTSQRRNSITASPLFVTWNTVLPDSSDRSLRGCIGTFEPQKLSVGLEQYTIISALQDTRFSPITTSELPSLEVSVTLLTDFEEAKDQLDWDLGVHGLKINFTAKNRRYGACYLPDVPVEQGWTKEETVISLMRKAGWTGRRDKWREVADFKATRFQGKAESLKWDEYVKWKKWVESINEE